MNFKDKPWGRIAIGAAVVLIVGLMITYGVNVSSVGFND
jgi:hypothetical protein